MSTYDSKSDKIWAVTQQQTGKLATMNGGPFAAGELLVFRRGDLAGTVVRSSGRYCELVKSDQVDDIKCSMRWLEVRFPDGTHTMVPCQARTQRQGQPTEKRLADLREARSPYFAERHFERDANNARRGQQQTGQGMHPA